MRGKMSLTLGVMAAALVVGGAASAAPASAEQPGTAPAAAVACSSKAPPSGYVVDSSYTPPNPCLKCQEAGRRLEASGRWRAYCWRVANPVPVLLYRFCV